MRVALVDDHLLLSAALGMALREEGHEVLVARVTTIGAIGAELLAFAPDVALIDLDLGAAGNGQDLLGAVASSGAAVIVVSATGSEWLIGRCLDLGAAGWIPKSAPIEELLAGVTAAGEGHSVTPLSERARLLEAWRVWKAAHAESHAPFGRLTPREAEILAGLTEGLTVNRIAAASFTSAATVRTQVRSILSKLGVNSQLEAVVLANRAGWKGPAS